MVGSRVLAALSKFIGVLVMPSGLLWILLAALAVFAWRRHPRLGAATFALWVSYTVVGNVWVGSWLIQALERQVDAVHPEDVPPLDALFVLGGGVKVGPRDWPEASGSGDRAILAVRLYHLGHTPVLVTSGRAVPGIMAPRDHTEDTSRLWRQLKVPESAIVRLSTPYRTSMELDEYIKLKAQRGWGRVGLLSSAYHLPRVMRNARRVGFDAIPIAADHRGGAPPFGLIGMVPQSSGFTKVQTACWELVGMLAGR
jgi:uncharacterized SAM-binding protein YcdF (DUF218 family)